MGDDEDMTQETVGQMELLDILSHTVFALAPTQIGTVDLRDLPDLVRAVVAERDLFRDDAIPKAAKIMTGLTEQRDALQARIDAYEGEVERWEEMDRLIAESSLGTPEAKAIRALAPPGVGIAITRAAQCAQERDQARAERDFAEAEFARENRRAVDLKIERDRLRAVVEVLSEPAVRFFDCSACRVTADVARDALRELDVSPTMGAEHDHVVDRNAIEAAGRCPDCGNPDRYCDCPDRTPAMGDVSDSLKRGIADAAADRVKSYGDFTRYVDDEPETPDTGTEPVTLLDGTPVPEPHASKIRRIARQLSAAFYVCPDHAATGGYESCCECGGWTDDDPDRGRLCTEASE